MSLESSQDELIRPEIAEVDGSREEETLEAAASRLGRNPDELVRLDANENVYGCSLRVQETLASYDRYHLRPDPFDKAVRLRLEDYSGIPRDRIVVGHSAYELLDLTCRVLLRPGYRAITCPPASESYREFARLAGADVVEVPRGKGFAVDAAGVAAAIDTATRLIFLGSPNDPTGTVLSHTTLIELLRTGAMVVLDESWWEFSGRTYAPLVTEFDNLVVLRSFGSSAGLTGVPTSYGFFPGELAEALTRVRSRCGANVCAQLAMIATLDDFDHVRRSVRRLRQERGRLFRQLRKLNFIQPYPSEANFLLCQVLKGSSLELKARLEADGILVRAFDRPPLENTIRVTVGTSEHTDLLMGSLRRMAPEIWAD